MHLNFTFIAQGVAAQCKRMLLFVYVLTMHLCASSLAQGLAAQCKRMLLFAYVICKHLCSSSFAQGLAAQCKHMLHLVPQWQSSVRHERLKEVMADRPDLIQSELAVTTLCLGMLSTLSSPHPSDRAWPLMRFSNAFARSTSRSS